MGCETEIKCRLGDPAGVLARLREARAESAGFVFEVNHILDTTDRRLLESGCGLRVREIRALDGATGPRATLTFKGPREPGAAKVREELETPVEDATAAIAVLARLGFRECVCYEKRRETWRLRGCEVAIDELPRLGWFVEIEGPDPAAIEAVRRDLGLANAAALAQTYVEMAAECGDSGRGGLRELRFSPSTRAAAQ